MDIDKIELLLEQVKILGIAGKQIMKDGKVDLADLPVLMSLLPQISQMIEATKGISEAFGELKDLDAAEGLAVVKKLYEVGNAIEQA